MKQDKQRAKNRETLGMIGAVLALGNAYGTAYLLGEWMLYGNAPHGWTVLPVAITAGIAAALAARSIARLSARLAPVRREGIIMPETICKIMKNQNKRQEAK